jgi:hypothetical protein
LSAIRQVVAEDQAIRVGAFSFRVGKPDHGLERAHD